MTSQLTQEEEDELRQKYNDMIAAFNSEKQELEKVLRTEMRRALVEGKNNNLASVIDSLTPRLLEIQGNPNLLVEAELLEQLLKTRNRFPSSTCKCKCKNVISEHTSAYDSDEEDTWSEDQRNYEKRLTHIYNCTCNMALRLRAQLQASTNPKFWPEPSHTTTLNNYHAMRKGCVSRRAAAKIKAETTAEVAAAEAAASTAITALAVATAAVESIEWISRGLVDEQKLCMFDGYEFDKDLGVFCFFNPAIERLRGIVGINFTRTVSNT